MRNHKRGGELLSGLKFPPGLWYTNLSIPARHFGGKEVPQKTKNTPLFRLFSRVLQRLVQSFSVLRSPDNTVPDEDKDE
jgi:hypothetical protein